MERWGLQARGAPLVSLACQGAPSNGREPQEEPWKVWPGTVDGALPGRGSSLTHVEVIAGSQASTEGAGVVESCWVRLGPSGLFCCLGS